MRTHKQGDDGGNEGEEDYTREFGSLPLFDSAIIRFPSPEYAERVNHTGRGVGSGEGAEKRKRVNTSTGDNFHGVAEDVCVMFTGTIGKRFVFVFSVALIVLTMVFSGRRYVWTTLCGESCARSRTHVHVHGVTHMIPSGVDSVTRVLCASEVQCGRWMCAQQF